MAELKVISEFSPAGDQPKAIKALSDGIKNGQNYQTLLGITGSGKTFTMAKVIESVQKPSIILSHNKVLAAQLYGEFKTLFPNNSVEFFISYYDYYQPEAYLPVTDTFIEKDMSMNEEIDRLRLRATSSLLSRQDVIIIASVSCIYGLGSPTEYKSMLVHLGVGDTLEIKSILRNLVDIHYIRNEMVLEPGTFRVRGDILEIFPIYDEKPLRIEFFGDEIERLSWFDPLTGVVINEIPRATIFPKTHYVTPKETVTNCIPDIKDELKSRLEFLKDNNKLVEAQRLQERTTYDIEMMRELGYCQGIENYSRYLSGRNPGESPPCLFDYIPKDAVVFIDESHVSVPQIGAMYKGDRSRKETLVEYGFRLPSALDNRPLKFEEWEMMAPQRIYVSATPSKYEKEHQDNLVELIIRPTGLTDPDVEIRPASTQIDDVIGECNERVGMKERVLITTLTKRMAEDLTDYLNENNISARYMHSDIDTVERVEIIRDLRLGKFDVLVGINLLREGLDIPEVSLVAILDADKEGFLRSDTTLIQTIGRAARNLRGKAILYADKVTGSMQRAIDETDRRRNIQEKYNKKNNISPKSISTKVKDIMEGARVIKGNTKKKREDIDKIISFKIQDDTIDNLTDTLKKLEDEMFIFAKKMEFEKAAVCRDKINSLKRKLIDL